MRSLLEYVWPERSQSVRRELLPATFSTSEPATTQPDELQHLGNRALLSLFRAGHRSSGGGRSLDQPTRALMESRFGDRFADVRIHPSSLGTEPAGDAVQARAVTVGQDIAFAAGEYRPETTEGRRLLAHELAHVVQQRRPVAGTAFDAPAAERDARTAADTLASGGLPNVRAQAPPGSVQMDGPTTNGSPDTGAATLPPLALPGSGLLFIPGPSVPTSVLGARLPLPGSLRITNAYSVGSAPGFVVDLSPQRFVLHLLDSLVLSSAPRSGTPPYALERPENQARTRLLNPTLIIDPTTGRLHGRSTLSIESDYPASYKTPTDVDVQIDSTELGHFSGRLAYGPLHADFTLRLGYDTQRIERALSPAFAPVGGLAEFSSHLRAILHDSVPGIRLESVADALQDLARAVLSGDIQAATFVSRTIDLVRKSLPPGFSVARLRTALNHLVTELTHPGFNLRGTFGLGPLPLGTFAASAPTTVPLARPLPGAPAAYPLAYWAGGVIIAPAGAITRTAVPAFGYTRSEFDATRGWSVTSAVLPTLDPTGKDLVHLFPVYGYLEVSHVRRVSDGLDVGIRFTAQVSSLDVQSFLAGRPAPAPPSAADQPATAAAHLLESMNRQATPATPNIGVSITGAF